MAYTPAKDDPVKGPASVSKPKFIGEDDPKKARQVNIDAGTIEHVYKNDTREVFGAVRITLFRDHAMLGFVVNEVKDVRELAMQLLEAADRAEEMTTGIKRTTN